MGILNRLEKVREFGQMLFIIFKWYLNEFSVKKYWKSRGILSVQKSGNHDLFSQSSHTFYFLGKLRYANNSNYKNDTMIRKEVSCNRSDDKWGETQPFPWNIDGPKSSSEFIVQQRNIMLLFLNNIFYHIIILLLFLGLRS